MPSRDGPLSWGEAGEGEGEGEAEDERKYFPLALRQDRLVWGGLDSGWKVRFDAMQMGKRAAGGMGKEEKRRKEGRRKMVRAEAKGEILRE